MGSTRFAEADYMSYAARVVDKPRAEVFKSRRLHPDLDPVNITVRESHDSPANPESTPIILASDVTGSMGTLAEQLIKSGLGVVMKSIYDRKPISDPHICVMAIGDHEFDQAPLQVTQFEASMALVSQMENIWLEGGGGSNEGESYVLAWWFALNRVKAHAIEKRRHKGYLFTIGDESPLTSASRTKLRALGGHDQDDLNVKALLAELKKDWEVFHLIVKPVPSQDVQKDWEALLGDRAVLVEDVKKLAEVVVSIIQVTEGHDAKHVGNSWDSATNVIVQKAVRGLLPA